MNSVTASAFLTGFGLGLGLIVAIGAQNAFVLRQGLRREHVLPIVVCCVVADVALMAAGVAGMARVIGDRPAVAAALAVGGAAFLLAYGARAAWRACRPGTLQAQGAGAPMRLGPALAQLAGFTLLNPHTYLDTVVLVGSVGAQQAGGLQWHFTAGAAVASGVWFTGLGFGARLLAPWFRRPAAWRVLDAVVAAVMVTLGAGLAARAFAG